MKKYSFLETWLEGRYRIDWYGKNWSLDKESYGYLSIDIVVPAHESLKQSAESLQASWLKTHRYIQRAMKIVQLDKRSMLDHKEAEMIRTELGKPPALCYPIYIISVEEKNVERVVYIGKTSSRKMRFRGGHTALTKLLDPAYDSLIKRLYLGGLVFLTDSGNTVPLEAVPLKQALKLLSSIEAQLIYQFQPELNTHHKSKNNAKLPVDLHIQNLTGKTDFLNDSFCTPIS